VQKTCERDQEQGTAREREKSLERVQSKRKKKILERDQAQGMAREREKSLERRVQGERRECKRRAGERQSDRERHLRKASASAEKAKRGENTRA